VNRLKPLIRLSRWKVDEQSRALAQLLEEEQRIRRADVTLQHQLEQERQAAQSSLEAAGMYGPFAAGISKRREALANELARLQTRIDETRDRLREAMGEAKKVEIADSNAKARERAEQKAKEDAMLDEAALEGFRRKKQ
jgi:flagellar export protein FliJ